MRRAARRALRTRRRGASPLVVARLLAAGRTRALIAKELGIAEATVRTLASRCYRKLGVSGRRELAVRLVGLAG